MESAARKPACPEARDGFTAQQIDLGRYLFFDPMLSGNGTVSCASCHHPDKGFSDDLPVSIGVAGTETHRAGAYPVEQRFSEALVLGFAS